MSTGARIITEQHAQEELTAATCPDYLIGLGRALEGAYGVGFDWPYFLEKPWKWSQEYVAWVGANYPTYSADETWQEFVDAIEGINRG